MTFIFKICCKCVGLEFLNVTVSGCIDCSHIPIRNPGGNNGDFFGFYFSNKLFY
ncbi:hypothetical protein FQR65_LT16586 [Abscondita terminalis]|nr:hypothetical protein FQR65_LT16586 [Abscondita terminalis]